MTYHWCLQYLPACPDNHAICGQMWLFSSRTAHDFVELLKKNIDIQRIWWNIVNHFSHSVLGQHGSHASNIQSEKSIYKPIFSREHNYVCGVVTRCQSCWVILLFTTEETKWVYIMHLFTPLVRTYLQKLWCF